MTGESGRDERVVALDPTSRGFGYAVLEGPAALVDWGARGARADEHDLVLARVAELLARYRPSKLIVEDVGSPHSRRCRRVVGLLADIRNLALARGIPSRAIPIEVVRKTFSSNGTVNKEGIAAAVAQHFPELARHLPPHRKPWMSEDVRMSVFDAVALALTHFYLSD